MHLGFQKYISFCTYAMRDPSQTAQKAYSVKNVLSAE